MITVILDGYNVAYAIPELARQMDRSRCVVVSNDNEVANNARAFSARVVSVQEFYKQARPEASSRPHPSAAPGKAAPSARDAQRITDDYRKHLEGKSKDSCTL